MKSEERVSTDPLRTEDRPQDLNNYFSRPRDEMKNAALRLAARKIPIFPCDWREGEHSKAPLVPSPGFHLATTDVDQIQRWWSRYPYAMIGAPVPPDCLVLDIDPWKDGSENDLGPLPPTLRVWSGRNDGGCHLFFRKPDGPLVSTRLPKGIDLRNGGKSYTILPPSLHPATGLPYRWDWRRPAGLPPRLLALLRPVERVERVAAVGGGNGSGLIRTVAETPKGNRDNTLYWAACCACRDGIIDQIEDQLVAAAVSQGFNERKAWNKIKSARRTVLGEC